MKRIVSFLLLLSYIMVVSSSGVSLLMAKPVVKVYVHSKDCQKKSYLQADCWDRCNGDQHIAKTSNKQKKDAVAVQILLDYHYQVQLEFVFFAQHSKPLRVCLSKQPHFGFLTSLYAPPQAV